MINFEYTFTAVEPLSHFGDEKTGNVSVFRRQKVALTKPIEIQSLFEDDRARVKAIVQIVYAIFKNKQRSVDYGGWDELQSKLKAYANSKTAGEFVNRLLESFDCRPITNADFYALLDAFKDKEFLDTIRDEHRLIVARVKALSDHDKEVKANGETPSLFFAPAPKDNEVRSTIRKHSEYVPYISGNSVRGALRNVVMKDWCEIAGIGDAENSLPLSLFHQLFTGGTITESTEYEDIEKRRMYVHLCPMIGLLGSAIGNMTLQGSLVVGQPILKCLENQNGEASFWEYMNLAFNTRTDDSKKETDIEFDGGGDDETHQMIFYREEICAGAQFDHRFILNSDNPILVSAFYRFLWLFTQNPYIGGNIARGCGKVQLNLPEYITENELWERGETYRQHVQDVRDSILPFFRSLTGKKGKK